jgi:predicted DNA-binding protein (MmcQ/YjbR family)
VNDERVLARLRAICLAFPEAEEAALQDRPLFGVRSRRFALFNGASSPPRPRWNGSGQSLHFVTDPREREALRQDGRFTPSPHHGDRGWVAIRLEGGRVDWTELAELLEAAYRHVAGRALVELLDQR